MKLEIINTTQINTDNSVKDITENDAGLASDTEGTDITTDKEDNTLSDITCTNMLIQSNVMKEDTRIVGGIKVVRCYEGSQLEQLIPVGEKAVEPNEDFYRMKEAWNLVSEPDLLHMANLQGTLSNCLYAGVREDSKGDRSVIYCQRYGSGKLSAKIEIVQADIMDAHRYVLGCIQTKTVPRDILRIIKDAERKYKNRFSGDPEELLNINEIIDTLYVALPALPVQISNCTYLEKCDFYQQVEGIARYMTTQALSHYKMYYPLTECDIMEMAGSLNMKRADLLSRLRNYGLLYLTPSSMGYQTNVRIKYSDGNTYNEWRYCIIKLNYIAGIENSPGTECSYDF